MRNGLPKRSLKTECGILNLDVEHGSGTHWTCWYKLDSQLIVITLIVMG